MVQTFHAAGIEVILDVVFNHTGEGGRGGHTVSWRGNRRSHILFDRSDYRPLFGFLGLAETL